MTTTTTPQNRSATGRRRHGAIALDDIRVIGRNSFRVTLNVQVAGRTRRVAVTLDGRRLVDIQADDGLSTWTASAGDPVLTQAAVVRAVEEVARVRALERLIELR
jgi:hypothetical protein